MIILTILPLIRLYDFVCVKLVGEKKKRVLLRQTGQLMLTIMHKRQTHAVLIIMIPFYFSP
jgi:hypothetical protein